MAKGSFLGVKRGKLGDAVGYNVTNSNDKDKQGWRVYQPVVSNPQTDGQIDQRIKLAAVNNLYRALKPIIQRGWENHKYGDESRRAFLKRALSASFEGPYLPKGSTLAVPIEGVPITYGSLTPVVVEGSSTSLVLTNVTFTSSEALSLGVLSQCFIDSVGAQAGDQVTIIIGHLNQAGTVSYRIESFFLDPTSTDEDLANLTGFDWLTETYDDNLCLAIDLSSESTFSPAYCGLVAMSRDGEGTNLRSYAEFDMTTEFKSYFYGSASQVERAKASYRKKEASSTNWPLVPDDSEITPSTAQEVVTLAGATVRVSSLGYTSAAPNYLQAIGGSTRLYVKGVVQEGSSTSVVYICQGDATTMQNPSDYSTAVVVNACSSANIANGFRQWLIDQGIPASLLVIE